METWDHMSVAQYEAKLKDGTPITIDIHFNQDFSGDITLTSSRRTLTEGDHRKEFVIPAKVLLRFVAFHYVVPRRSRRLKMALHTDDVKGAIEELLR